jgi:hypothetical protein
MLRLFGAAKNSSLTLILDGEGNDSFVFSASATLPAGKI